MNPKTILRLSSLPLKYIKNKLFISSPVQASFAVTLRCNCHCNYCDWWKYDQKDLSTNEAKRVIYQIARLGVIHIGLSGGEPLVRSDLPKLIQYAKSLGMLVSVSTNGIISKETTYREIMKSGLDTLTFSIDGTNAQTHESFRKGCPLDRVISSLNLAVKLRHVEGYSTRINSTTVINRANATELAAINEMCQSLGVDHCNYQPIWPVMKDKEFFKKYGFESNDRDADLLRFARDSLMGMRNSNLRRYSQMLPDFYLNYENVRKIECYAGRTFIYVDAKGLIYPCVLLEKPFGSLLNGDAKKLFKIHKSKDIIKGASRQECPGCSLNCHMERNLMMDSIKRPKDLAELLLYRFSKKRKVKDKKL